MESSGGAPSGGASAVSTPVGSVGAMPQANFETVSFESTDIQSYANTSLDSETAMESAAVPVETQDFEEIVNSPGTPHDKLAAFSEMDASEKTQEQDVDQALDENEEVTSTSPNSEQTNNGKKMSLDEQVVDLHTKTLALLMKRMNGQATDNQIDKELKDLLAQLKYLLEKMGQGNGQNSAVGNILMTMLLLLEMGTKGEQKLEQEVKVA